MRYLFFGLMLSFLLCACTESSQIKDQSIQQAKKRFKSELKTEADKNIDGKDELKRTYVRIVFEKTDFDSDRIDIQGNSASSLVVVKTVPVNARKTLREIISRLSEKEERSFNVSDGLHLVSQQLKIGPDEHSNQVYKFMFAKKNDWILIPEK